MITKRLFARQGGNYVVIYFTMWKPNKVEDEEPAGIACMAAVRTIIKNPSYLDLTNWVPNKFNLRGSEMDHHERQSPQERL